MTNRLKEGTVLIETVISPKIFFLCSGFSNSKASLKWCLRFIFIEIYENFGFKSFVGMLFQSGITRLKKLFRRYSLFVFVLFISVSLRGRYLKLAFCSFSEVLNSGNRLFRYFQKYVTDLYSSINLMGKILFDFVVTWRVRFVTVETKAFTAQFNCFSNEVSRFCDMPFKRIAGCCFWLKTRAFNSFRQNSSGRKVFTVYSVLIPQAIF